MHSLITVFTADGWVFCRKTAVQKNYYDFNTKYSNWLRRSKKFAPPLTTTIDIPYPGIDRLVTNNIVKQRQPTLARKPYRS